MAELGSWDFAVSDQAVERLFSAQPIDWNSPDGQQVLKGAIVYFRKKAFFKSRSVGGRLDAEDLAQEYMFKLISTFNRGVLLENRSRLGMLGLMHRITQTVFIDIMRKKDCGATCSTSLLTTIPQPALPN